MPVVFIPPSLRQLTQGVQRVELTATTVREVVARLEERFPGIGARLCDSDGLRPGLAVAIDSRISDLGFLERVEPDSEVHFVSAVGGG